MSAIGNLKKAFEAQAVTSDDWSLQKFHAKKEVNEVARMNIIGIESKYVPKFDKRNLPEGSVMGAGNMGFRTRFFLADGETIGTFSNAAHGFFEFFATAIGYSGQETFAHIDIEGNILVDLTVLPLDSKKSTYDFKLIEEGSTYRGLSEYVPNAASFLLELPTGEPSPE